MRKRPAKPGVFRSNRRIRRAAKRRAKYVTTSTPVTAARNNHNKGFPKDMNPGTTDVRVQPAAGGLTSPCGGALSAVAFGEAPAARLSSRRVIARKTSSTLSPSSDAAQRLSDDWARTNGRLSTDVSL